MDDAFAAYCFDEACCWIMAQLDEGKRPFFTRVGGAASANSRTIDLLRQLGAEVKHFD